MPQAAHRSEAIKHMLVAMAMYDKSLSLHLDQSSMSTLALRRYSAAITSFTREKPMTDIILFMCMIGATFEYFRGRPGPVLMHLASARKIVREFRAKTPMPNGFLQSLIANHVEPMLDRYRVQEDSSTACFHERRPEVCPGIQSWRDSIPPEHYTAASDVEHDLVAHVLDVLRLFGSIPCGVLRFQLFCEIWLADAKSCRELTESGQIEAVMALYNVAQAIARVLFRDLHGATEAPINVGAVLDGLHVIADSRNTRLQRALMPVMDFFECRKMVDEASADRFAELSAKLARLDFPQPQPV